MNCPSCNKFASLDFNDPELEGDVEFEGGIVRATVRLERTSSCCSEPMKEATLELETEIPEEIVTAHNGPQHEISVEETGIEQIDEGGGRYKKSYFGAIVNFEIRCSCQKKGADPLFTGSLEDKLAASEMEELN